MMYIIFNILEIKIINIKCIIEGNFLNQDKKSNIYQNQIILNKKLNNLELQKQIYLTFY